MRASTLIRPTRCTPGFLRSGSLHSQNNLLTSLPSQAAALQSVTRRGFSQSAAMARQADRANTIGFIGLGAMGNHMVSVTEVMSLCEKHLTDRTSDSSTTL